MQNQVYINFDDNIDHKELVSVVRYVLTGIGFSDPPEHIREKDYKRINKYFKEVKHISLLNKIGNYLKHKTEKNKKQC